MTERFKAEVIRGLRAPKPQRIDIFSTVANRWTVIRYPDHAGCFSRNRAQGSALHFKGTIKLDPNLIVRPHHFPRGPDGEASCPALPAASRHGWFV